MYAMDSIINEAANWHYMCGGKSSVPVVIWGIVNRGGEQAAQHSQAFHALFAHIPGLKVVMPSTPYDAKGLLIAAIRDKNPVIYVDDRWLYPQEGPVPEEIYEVPIGKGIIRKKGADLTLVSSSYMVIESLRAAQELAEDGIDVELIDLRTVKPLDEDILLKSVKKTGKMVIADGGWKNCGISADVSALVSEKAFQYLKAPIRRVTLPDSPAPASRMLEKKYYPDAKNITATARDLIKYGK